MTEPEETIPQRRRRRWKPESKARTERVLGQLGLFALGTCGGISVVGIVIIALSERSEVAQDSFTALSTIAAASVGALAGWFARNFTAPLPPDPPIDHADGVEKYDPTNPDDQRS